HQVARPLAEDVLQFLPVEAVLPRLADAGRDVAEQLLDESADIPLDVPVENVGADETDATVGDDEAVGDEVVIGVCDGEVIYVAGEVLDRFDGGDAFPDHAAEVVTDPVFLTELRKRREVLTDARGVEPFAVKGTLDETLVDLREEPGEDLTPRGPGRREDDNIPGGVGPLLQPLLFVLEVLDRQGRQPRALLIVLVPN